MASPGSSPQPTKSEVARVLLGQSSVFIHLDPRRSGVNVPARFLSQSQLVLQVGYDMPIPIPDLTVGEEGMSCTLSFNRSPFHCVLPWASIYALVGEDGKGYVWKEDAPPEVQLAGAGQRAAPRRDDGAGEMPEEVHAWLGTISGQIRRKERIEPRRAVVEIDGARIVLDLAARTFGHRLSISYGQDAADAPAAGGIYRGGPAFGDLPRVVFRPRTTLGSVLEALRLVRAVRVPNAVFQRRVSTRSEADAARVLALAQSDAVRGAVVDVFDDGFEEVAIRREGAMISASARHIDLPLLQIDRVIRVCRSVLRIGASLQIR